MFPKHRQLMLQKNSRRLPLSFVIVCVADPCGPITWFETLVWFETLSAIVDLGIHISDQQFDAVTGDFIDGVLQQVVEGIFFLYSQRPPSVHILE